METLGWWTDCLIASGSHGGDLEPTVEVQSERGPRRIVCRIRFQNLEFDTNDHSPS